MPTRDSPDKVSYEAAWSDAAVILPWNMYQFYGDTSILRQQYDSMKAWVDVLVEEDGENFGWREHFQYGDWLALDGISVAKEDSFGGTDEGFIASIYFANSAQIVAKTARILGKEQEAGKYQKIAEYQWQGIKDEYFSKTGRCCVDTQTGLLLALKYHLSSDEKAVEQRLGMLLEKGRNMLRTGFIGTPIVCKVLSEHGMSETAYRILLREDYPGWLQQVKLGATTVWERWNSLDENGNISGTGMNSLNHYAYGAVAEWLFGYAAGLKIGDLQSHTPGTRFADTDPMDTGQLAPSVGGRYMRIEPELNWDLRSVDAKYHSAAGYYRCAWELPDPFHVKLSVEIPFGCEADLLLPLAKEQAFRHLEAGEYEFLYETEKPLHIPLGLRSKMKSIMENPHAVSLLRKYMPIDLAGPALYDKTLEEIIGLLEMFSPQDVRMYDPKELEKKLSEL